MLRLNCFIGQPDLKSMKWNKIQKCIVHHTVLYHIFIKLEKKKEAEPTSTPFDFHLEMVHRIFEAMELGDSSEHESDSGSSSS